MGLDIICPIFIVIQSLLYIITVIFYRKEVDSLENQKKELLDMNTRLNNLEKANLEVLGMILSCISDDEDDIGHSSNNIENGLKNIIENKGA